MRKNLKKPNPIKEECAKTLKQKQNKTKNVCCIIDTEKKYIIQI